MAKKSFKLSKKAEKILKEKMKAAKEAVQPHELYERKIAPLFEIRQREGSEKNIMVGANTILTIDGVPVKGAMGVKFEVNAKGVAKALITVVGRFKIQGRPVVKTIKLYK